MTILELKKLLDEYAKGTCHYLNDTDVYIGEYNGHNLFNIGDIRTVYIGDKKISVLVPNIIDYSKSEKELQDRSIEHARLMLYEYGVLKHTEPKKDLSDKPLEELFGETMSVKPSPIKEMGIV